VGEEFTRIAALDATFHMPTYARKPVLFVRGEGMRLFDDDGREYLDFVAGIGSVNLGHSHPAVVEAVRDQIGRLTQVSNLFYVEHRDELAADLAMLFADDAAWPGPAGAAVRHSAPTKVFFCNSGAEANEGAIKLARRWGKARRGSGCFRIVTAERSFHGRTLGALAATGQASKQEAFAPLPDGFDHVPLNDLAALDSAVTADTCAVLLEPVQGEGGVYACDPGYLEAARALCDERGVLLMFDEVQTGLYRTGPVFAHHAYGVRPDVMCLAKSLANGLPIGAVVAHGEAADAFSPGDHGSTFGGGPVVCAAARACLTALAGERLGANARESGSHLRSRLTALGEDTGAVAEVRGVGLMNAVELARPVAVDAAAALLSRGLVVNSIGTSVLRMLPPLVCGKPEIDTLIDALYEVLAEVDGRRVGR
jgi:acetylornithine/N-succinyldiaminopimelate aminotransferase